MSDYTDNQKKYIDSVGGHAHASAVDIIVKLDSKIQSLTTKLSKAASRNRELVEALEEIEQGTDVEVLSRYSLMSAKEVHLVALKALSESTEGGE